MTFNSQQDSLPPFDEATTAAGLDVAETDDFLYSLFIPRVVSMCKHFDGVSPSLVWWIQAILQGATLWMTSGQTPAMQALGLKTIDTTKEGGHSSTQQATRERSIIALVKWIVLSALLPAAFRQLRAWYDSLSNDVNDDANLQTADPIVLVARERQRRLLATLLNTVDRILPILRLHVLLSWWIGKNERRAAPTLAMTLAGLSLESTRPPQRLYVNFAHRRWLYQELVNTLKMVAPFGSWNDFVSCLHGVARPVRSSLERMVGPRNAADDANRCPICRSNPIVIPYATDCGHVYCYSCLWKATNKKNRYACRVCRRVVSSIGPYLVPLGDNDA